ncbi:unnamed protein product [Meloidogyne enterolobii]|uniref:Uncharacterized protein n=1 Tax=Meloidogyne enterolobii TaxID=390850 RepID=A0ACB1BAG7_MELEN
MSLKRSRNSFNPDWEKQYNFVKRSRKGNGYFFCLLCQRDYNIESMGVSGITQHQDQKKHKEIEEEKMKNETMRSFVRNKSVLGTIDMQVAAAEGMYYILLILQDGQHYQK